MIPGFGLLSLIVAMVTMGTPVVGLVENRPCDDWMVLEISTGPGSLDHIDYEVSRFPCSPHEGQKFFGTLRPNGNLLITQCVEDD